jgi:hypothetical protein
MNNHQIKRRRIDGLAPAVLSIIIAVLLLILFGVLVHAALSSVTDALHQAGTR